MNQNRKATANPTVAASRPRVMMTERSAAIMSMAIGIIFCLSNIVYVDRITSSVLEFDDPSRKLEATARPVDFHDTNHVDTGTNDNDKGKEPLIRILKEAGIEDLDQESFERLPTWSQVVELYGESPRIVGLETCQSFRESVDPNNAFPAPAGAFNSGTNLLSTLLRKNCHLPNLREEFADEGARKQVNWGKHQPPRVRLEHKLIESINNTDILPVVSIRDPYSWMQSMCRHSYAGTWDHSDEHCPNLVLNQADFDLFGKNYYRRNFRANLHRSSEIAPVYVDYNKMYVYHDSLVGMWNDWYNEYVQADFPRVLVRMEDLVFHTRNVTQAVCECAGGMLREGEFQYVQGSAKPGHNFANQYKTTMLDAMIRYGSAQSNLERIKGMTKDDIAYARSTLSPDLMEAFGYRHPEEVNFA